MLVFEVLSQRKKLKPQSYQSAFRPLHIDYEMAHLPELDVYVSQFVI